MLHGDPFKNGNRKVVFFVIKKSSKYTLIYFSIFDYQSQAFIKLAIFISKSKMTVDKDTIKETWNILSKLTSSERWTFTLIMIIAFASIVTTVILYIKSMDKLIEKYNTTIQQQEERFLNAQQKMQDWFFEQLNKIH